MPRRSSILTPLLLLAAFLLSIATCRHFFGDVTEAVQNIITPRTPREAFAYDSLRVDLAEQPLVAAWDSAYRAALDDTLYVDLPYRERLRYVDSLPLSAVSLRFFLPAGRRLTAAILPDPVHAKSVGRGGPSTPNPSDGYSATTRPPIFAELFAAPGSRTPDPNDALLRWEAGDPRFNYESPSPTGQELLLLIQAAPADSGTYELALRTDPALTFPVAGASTKNIQSFWGDSRSGGARRHEGNDIFAARGTPAVAVADGRVYSTREGGLGGKTVWLRDGEGRGITYYYAHLDTQLVRRGQSVRRGDTLGLVGNTGNARTTPPHLHFGIYRDGARDPFPYLLGPDGQPKEVGYSLTDAPVSVPGRGNHYLRQSPERDRLVVVRQLENEEPITILGATERYYRIRTRLGETGYANFD